MIEPKWDTDAAPPEYQSKGLIFLAGAIKYWWLHVCNKCGAYYMDEPENNRCTGMHEYTGACKPDKKPFMDECNGWTRNLWGGPEHTAYKQWRKDVNDLLIAEKYLVYRPHEAFKGVWTEEAQAVNDVGIYVSKVMLVLSPPNIPTEGTDAEVEIARGYGKPVIYAPPGTDPVLLKALIEEEISALI